MGTNISYKAVLSTALILLVIAASLTGFVTPVAAEGSYVPACAAHLDENSSVGEMLDVCVVEIHRFYNTQTGTHFYTQSNSEKDKIIANYPWYNYEGRKYKVQTYYGSVAVHRFFNKDTKAHFYTTSEDEANKVKENMPQFVYEGIKFYVEGDKHYDPTIWGEYSNGFVPVYRFFNTETKVHFYTDSESEKDKVLRNLPQFDYEGIGFWTRKDTNLFTNIMADLGLEL